MANGLLDFMNTPAGMGLLSAAAGGLATARRGTPINNLGRAGVAGLAGYNAAQDDLMRQANFDELKRLRDVQMQQMQMQIDQAQGQQKWKAGLPGVIAQAAPKVEQFQPDTFDANDNPFGQMANVQPGNPQALQDYLMQPHSPYADKLIEKQLFPKEEESYSLSPGQARFVGGRQVAALPDKPTELPSAIREYEYAKTQGYRGTFKEFKESNAKAGATSVTIPISNEKKYGEKFAEKIADMDQQMLDAAQKAPELAARANRIKEVIGSNKVITGFGADYRLAFGKALGLSGADNEIVANTEALAADLSKNTLDSIKASGLGSGSGFSNADRDFLEKAAGGKITMEGEALSRLADLSHRAAMLSADRWNKRSKKIPSSALEGTGIGTDDINVPALYSGETMRPNPPKFGEVRNGYYYKGGDPADQKSWVKK